MIEYFNYIENHKNHRKPVEVAGNKNHPEGICEKCGGPNITWYAPNKLWNQYAGNYRILCPICFAKLAESAGCTPTAWKLDIEKIPKFKSFEINLVCSIGMAVIGQFILGRFIGNLKGSIIGAVIGVLIGLWLNC